MMKMLKLWDNSIHKPQGRTPVGETWNGRLIKELNQEKVDFDRLRNFAGDLNSRLHDKGFVEKNLYLFGDNYEHNTDDNLLNVIGWNDNNYMIETGNLVGYVSTKNFTLNISSRFGDEFLKYLIINTEGFLEVPENGNIGRGGLYNWLMVFLWKNSLIRAYRFGIPKQYIAQNKRLFTVKGSVDVLDFAVNRGKDGRILCHFYQHDYNNPVTQLIAYTFSKIEQKELIKDCIQLKNTFENCTEGKRCLLEACLDTRPVTNPYYAEYNKVISLSKNILRRRFGDITDSSDISSAFLFDMSMLFEHYIRKVLKKHFTLFPKNEESMTISSGLGRAYDRHLYPDIVIDMGYGENGRKNIKVYDVKYKHFDIKYGIKREDLFQLHTYVLYLSNYYNILSCGIIYPQEGNAVEDTKSILQHPQYREGIPLQVLFFNIPKIDYSILHTLPSKVREAKLDETQKTFIDGMKDQEELFANKLKEHSLPEIKFLT